MIRIYERPTVKVPGLTSLFVSFDFNQLIVDEIKLLQNTFFNPETREWEIPLTALSEFLDRCCKIDSVDLNLLECDQDVSFDVTLQSYKTTPFDYQLDGIKYGLQHDRFLLLDAPGLGKSLQLIYLAQELKEKENLQHCLIVCGINSLKTNWKSEIEKHSNLSCTILGQRINKKGKFVVDGIDKRLEQLKNPIEEFFVITNVETLRNDKIIQALLKNKHNKFDMIVVDEIHKCKGQNSQQSKNLLKLNNAKHRVGATGTLIMNNPLDAYVPLKWLGHEHSTFSNYRYYYCSYGGPFNNMLIGFKNLTVLQEQLKKYSLRRTKDILDLPPKTIIPEYIELNDAQSIFYNNIKEGIAAEVDKVKLTTANTLAITVRLRQATACPSILTTESIESSKIERAVDIAEQLISCGEKVVIFSTFKQTVYELYKQLCNYGVVLGTGDQDDAELELSKTKFQDDPSTRIFLGTWQRSGTGITLTAASYMIFIDTPFTAAEFEQNSDRIHRIGAKNPVFIYNLIAKDTIDERVWEIVNDKEAISDYIVDEKISEKGLNSLRKYIEEFI